MSRVVVLGAGISGLSSALCLLKLYRAEIQDLLIVASEFPGDYHAHDYTSPWAGANWESFAKDSEIEQINRDKISYKRLMQLADDPTTGIKKYKLKVFQKRSEPLPWFITQKFVEDISIISREETSARNFDPDVYIGFEHTTVTVPPSAYNHFLLSQIKQLGGTVKKVRRLDVIEDISKVLNYTPDLVINCTGINAGKLLRNVEPQELEKIYPIKGQILQVYEDLPFQIVIQSIPSEDRPLPNQFLNIFPRPEGGCIIGGIFREGDYSRDIDEKLSESILRVVKNHVPEMKSTSVYNVYTALRPGRKGGVRVGLSRYNLPNKGSLNVVHNYGIGGAGYQSSHGLAMEVCLCAGKILGRPNGSRPFKL